MLSTIRSSHKISDEQKKESPSESTTTDIREEISFVNHKYEGSKDNSFLSSQKTKQLSVATLRSLLGLNQGPPDYESDALTN